MRCIGICACLCLTVALAAVEIHMDDFLLPVAAADADKAALRIVQQPDAVKTSLRDGLAVVAAATAQDAINAVVNERAPGCRRLQFGSGFGYVAIGQGSYQEMANPTATRVAKRQAYLKAYIMAKVELAKTLKGLSTESQEQIRSVLATATDETADAVNLDERSNETLSQATEMLLRGFVVYDVEDDVANNRVLVSIVTTPRTRREVNRPTVSTIEAGSVEAALQHVINEVQSGIVPPVGMRVIRVRGTDSLAFVGFGSDVIKYHQTAGVQARLRVAAETSAAARARDALGAALTGEDTAWESRIDETTRTSLKEFEETGVDDAAGVKRIADARQTFLNVFKQSEEFASISAGRLPGGVRSRSWVSGDGGTAYAMAVYVPGLVVTPPQPVPAGDPPAGGPGVDPVEPGPTGQVTDPADVSDPGAPDWIRSLERQGGWLYGVGKGTGSDAAGMSLREAQLQIALQLVVSVTGITVSTGTVTTLSDEEQDRIRIRDHLFQQIRTESTVKNLIGVQILRQEEVGGIQWTLVALDQQVFVAAVLARIAEIDARLQPLLPDPDPLTVDSIRQVTLSMPLIREREGLGLMLLGVGQAAPASPLAPGLLHQRIGRLADGTDLRLEGHENAGATRDAVLDSLDDLGLSLRQEADSHFELRLREIKTARVVGEWYKVTLTGCITVVDGLTAEVLGSLESKVQDASTGSEAEALDRCRTALIPALKTKMLAELLLLMMGTGAP